MYYSANIQKCLNYTVNIQKYLYYTGYIQKYLYYTANIQKYLYYSVLCISRNICILLWIARNICIILRISRNICILLWISRNICIILGISRNFCKMFSLKNSNFLASTVQVCQRDCNVKFPRKESCREDFFCIRSDGLYDNSATTVYSIQCLHKDMYFVYSYCESHSHQQQSRWHNSVGD